MVESFLNLEHAGEINWKKTSHSWGLKIRPSTRASILLRILTEYKEYMFSRTVSTILGSSEIQHPNSPWMNILLFTTRKGQAFPWIGLLVLKQQSTPATPRVFWRAEDGRCWNPTVQVQFGVLPLIRPVTGKFWSTVSFFFPNHEKWGK